MFSVLDVRDDTNAELAVEIGGILAIRVYIMPLDFHI